MFGLLGKEFEEELKSEHFLAFQTTLVKLVQPENAEFSILVTLFPISTLVKL